MMYQNRLVLAIKVNGRILREVGDTVALPFGCEYSLLIKNLDSVRIQVSASIDGTPVVDGHGGRLILGPNSDMEIERFIRNGNLEAGNRFRFIERTQDLEERRGIGVEDGLVRVESWRERVYVRPSVPYYGTLSNQLYPASVKGPLRSGGGQLGGQLRSTRIGARSAPPRPDLSASLGRFTASSGEVERCTAINEAGITVPGSESRQRFHLVDSFPLESRSTVIVLQLVGQVGEQMISQPVTVSHKATCSTCGRTSKAQNNYCPSCGTALQLV